MVSFKSKSFRKYFYLNYLLTLLIFTSCAEKVKIDEINGGYVDNNSLLINLKVKFSKATTASVHYWINDSPDTLTTKLSIDKVKHSFVLTHMVSEQDYSYQVIYKQGSQNRISEVYSFKTGPLPSILPSFDLVQGDEHLFDGYVMIRRMTNPGSQIMLNSQGEVVWYQLSDSVLFRPFYISSDSSYLALKATDEILEMSIAGDTLLHLSKGFNDFNRDLHHEIYRNELNQIVALTKEEASFDCTSLGGATDDIVVGDGILVMDSLGNKVWSWNIFDAIEVEISAEIYKARKDWSHANALKQDIDGNYLISFRNFNQIWKVDATDGSVIWKLGDNGDFDLTDTDYFVGQHAVHINPRGELMIFDNTVEETNSSRALAFTIDEQAMTAKATLVVDLPESLYSFKQGNVYFIDNTKLMFCSSMTNKIVITDLNGNILWQVNSDQSFYRAEYFSAERVKLNNARN